MKTFKNVLIGMLLVAPLLLPVSSRAGGFTDWLHSFFVEHHGDRPMPVDRPGDVRYRPYDPYAYRGGPPNGSNSVPINGGLAVLLGAGLLFGAKKIYDLKNRTAAVTER